MKDKKTGLLFDLDGTLWDSSEAVVRSWNEVIRTLPDFHKEVTLEDMTHLMGKTMDEIAYEFFDTVSKPRALELMQMCTDNENVYIEKHGGNLMPDLEETLKILSKEYFLAIVSNCQQGYIEAFLSYHKLGKYFDDRLDFATTNLPKGDNIAIVVKRNSLDRAFYIGDIQGDKDASDHAGIPFIHASYGYGAVPDAPYRIPSLSALPSLLKNILQT